MTRTFSNDLNHLKFKHTCLTTCKRIFIDSLLKLRERAIAQPHFECFGQSSPEKEVKEGVDDESLNFQNVPETVMVTLRP